MALYRRKWLITLDDVEISDLACTFKVTKTLTRTPNSCDVTVKNLRESTRKHLSHKGGVSVRVEAGYVGAVSQIYLGQVRSIMAGASDGPDIVTRLSSGDAEKILARTRINIPVGARMPIGEALKRIVDALGVGKGNVGDVAARLNATGRALWPRGTVLEGRAARILDDFCKSARLEWSIQDGSILLLDIGGSLETEAVELSADSGLYGSPELGTNGQVKCKSAMIAGLYPGRRVVLKSRAISGTYRVIDAEYSGDTNGDDWGISMTLATKARPL